MASRREFHEAFRDINKAIKTNRRSERDSLSTVLSRIESRHDLRDNPETAYSYALTADGDFDNIVKHGLKRGTKVLTAPHRIPGINLLRFPTSKCKGGYVERRFIEVFLDGDEYDDANWIPLGALR